MWPPSISSTRTAPVSNRESARRSTTSPASPTRNRSRRCSVSERPIVFPSDRANNWSVTFPCSGGYSTWPPASPAARTLRLGFPFASIEALVTERAAENYVSFLFKGGAADYPRRMARAALVADILQQFGFRAEVKEDATFARQEGREEGFMRERLRILGYLIIHTRQLDMVMANRGSFHRYREKILHDLGQVVLCRSPSPASRN